MDSDNRAEKCHFDTIADRVGHIMQWLCSRALSPEEILLSQDVIIALKHCLPQMCDIVSLDDMMPPRPPAPAPIPIPIPPASASASASAETAGILNVSGSACDAANRPTAEDKDKDKAKTQMNDQNAVIAKLKISRNRLFLKTCRSLISRHLTDNISNHHYSNPRRIVFECACVLLFWTDSQVHEQVQMGRERFLRRYASAFPGRSESELNDLIFFRNMLACAVQLIPAEGNKGHLKGIVGRLTDGYMKSSVSAGVQSTAAADREHIYTAETGIVKRKSTRR